MCAVLNPTPSIHLCDTQVRACSWTQLSSETCVPNKRSSSEVYRVTGHQLCLHKTTRRCERPNFHLPTEPAFTRDNPSLSYRRLDDEAPLNHTASQDTTTTILSMLTPLLQRCMYEDDLEAGQVLQGLLARKGLDADASSNDCEDCLDIHFATPSGTKDAFDAVRRRAVSTWSAIILAYANLGHKSEALRFFNEMMSSSIEPEGHIFVPVLKACCGGAALQIGRSIHASIINCGFKPDLYVESALMVMYLNCGSFVESCITFEKLGKSNRVSWNVLLSGFTEHVDGHEALRVFQLMQQHGVKPDQATFVSVLKACAVAGTLHRGEHIHSLIMGAGLESDAFIGSTLVDMYVKCAALDSAMMVFGRLSGRNFVTWTALISGYVQHGHGLKALQLFREMLQEGVVPNRVTFMCMLKACSSMTALRKGREYHSCIIESGLETDSVVSSALIDMYGKCGSMEEACTVFNRSLKRDVVTWSALIAGYTQLNDFFSAEKCLNQMQSCGCLPDAITFLCLLSACSRAGLLEEGCRQFKLMVNFHCIYPILDHFNCMVGLFGHKGRIEEAEDLLETIPCRDNHVGWRSLLHSCRKHANVHRGRRCFEYVQAENGVNAAGYLLMEQIYDEVGMHSEVEKLETCRRRANGWKMPAKAFVEIGNEVHEFTVGDKVHIQSDAIYAKLGALNSQSKMETKGLSSVLLLELVEAEKDAVCGHCEKLAIAFGLISTPAGTTIRVAKNIRMCHDCHHFIKHVSKVESRQIILKDSFQIHKFEDGSCSCRHS